MECVLKISNVRLIPFLCLNITHSVPLESQH